MTPTKRSESLVVKRQMVNSSTACGEQIIVLWGCNVNITSTQWLEHSTAIMYINTFTLKLYVECILGITKHTITLAPGNMRNEQYDYDRYQQSDATSTFSIHALYHMSLTSIK